MTSTDQSSREVIFVSQAQFDRLWETYARIEEERGGVCLIEANWLRMQGYKSLWSYEIGAWVRVSPFAESAVIGAEAEYERKLREAMSQ